MGDLVREIDKAFTAWVLAQLKKNKDTWRSYSAFARDVWSKDKGSVLYQADRVRRFGAIRNEGSRWTLAEVCRVAQLFGMGPGGALAAVEAYYHQNFSQRT